MKGVRVICEEFGCHGDGPDVLTAVLDDGTGINSWCIVENPEKERAELERQLQRIYRAGLERAIELVIAYERESLDKAANWEPNPSCTAEDAREWAYAAGQLVQRLRAALAGEGEGSDHD